MNGDTGFLSKALSINSSPKDKEYTLLLDAMSIEKQDN